MKNSKYRSSLYQKRSKVQLGSDRDKARYRSHLEGKEGSKVQIKYRSKEKQGTAGHG
jgi:hypothetical protein